MAKEKKQELGIKRLSPPKDFCLKTQPQLSIRYFGVVESCFREGYNVLYDLAEIENISEETVAVIIAQIKDSNIHMGRIKQISFPNREDLKSKLHQWGIEKKVHKHLSEHDTMNIPIFKVQNKLVASVEAKNIVIWASNILYGQVRKIKELYEILIELMANTNNHASSSNDPLHPWFFLAFYNSDNQSIKFIFIDLGVGLFESLPVKQYLNKHPVLFSELRSTLYKRGAELTKIYSELAAGMITSRTGLKNRGRGMPLINKHAQCGIFNSFTIISNDGFVDAKNNKVSVMNENFKGTLFSFEIQSEVS